MKVILYGATGNSGSRILNELTGRGHHVTAVVRDPEKLAGSDLVSVVAGDLSATDPIARIAGEDSDAIVSAYAPPPGNTDELVRVTERLIGAVRLISEIDGGRKDRPRLLIVGGAGSLFVAPGVTLLDSGHLPEAWRSIAQSHVRALDLLRSSGINWTYFSPSGFFEPGERTGQFRVGTDDLLTGANGESRISMEDYAIALVDELENPRFANGRRFTAGY